MGLTEKEMQLLFDYATSENMICDCCPCTDYGSVNSSYVSPTGLHSCEGSCCKVAFDNWFEELDKDEVKDILVKVGADNE